MSGGHVQMPLPLPVRPAHTFTGFVVQRNLELISHLQTLPECFELLWLYSDAGHGRTHLLQATCKHAQDAGWVCAYLDGAEPGVGNRLQHLLDARVPPQLIALDNLFDWLRNPSAEAQLMQLYQLQFERQARLIVAAERSPLEHAFALADLASRMRAAVCYRIHPIDEAGRRTVLQRIARQRGLQLDEGVLDYWLARSGRELGSLVAQLRRLDDASLSSQRRLTVPLVREVLGL